MDYDKLTSELRDDPLGRGYANMTDQEVVASGMEKNRPAASLKTVPRSVVSTWATNGSEAHPTGMPRIVRLGLASKRSTPFDAIPWSAVGAAIGALNIASLDTANLDLTDSTQVKSLALLVSAGIFTQAESDELYAMSAGDLRSRWDELGIGAVGDGHVHSAREMI